MRWRRRDWLADRAIRRAEYMELMAREWPESPSGNRAIFHYLEALRHRPVDFPAQLLQPGTHIEQLVSRKDGHICARIVSHSYEPEPPPSPYEGEDEGHQH